MEIRRFTANHRMKLLPNPRSSPDVSEMDRTDQKIIELLAEDSRRALADIGASVDLVPSSVNDRIRRLSAAGAIRRFTIEVSPAAFGRETLAFLWVSLRDEADDAAFCAHLATLPAVSECHHVTGPWSYLLKLRLTALAELEGLVADLKARGFLGRAESVVALSSPIPESLTLPPAR